jgi:orotate phosphoribosyltransferase
MPNDSAARSQTIFREHNIDTVASPAIGGLVIGFAVAQALDVRFIWTERQDGVMTLRRGFALEPGVKDSSRRGRHHDRRLDSRMHRGSRIERWQCRRAASIIDRSNGVADVGVPRIALVKMDVPTYQPDACPLCATGDVAYKPGSRK